MTASHERGARPAGEAKPAGAFKQAVGEDAWLVGIVRSSHDAIVGETLDGTVTTWNGAAEDLYGYRAEEITGQRADRLYPPERRADEAALVRQVVRGERLDQYVTERICRDGTVATVSLSVFPVIDAMGAIIGIASVSRGMSACRCAGAEVLALLDAVPDAIVVVGTARRIVLANAEAERLFGYPRGELVGQLVEVLLPEAERMLRSGHVTRHTADPRRPPVGVRGYLAGRRKDGAEVPV